MHKQVNQRDTPPFARCVHACICFLPHTLAPLLIYLVSVETESLAVAVLFRRMCMASPVLGLCVRRGVKREAGNEGMLGSGPAISDL